MGTGTLARLSPEWVAAGGTVRPVRPGLWWPSCSRWLRPPWTSAAGRAAGEHGRSVCGGTAKTGAAEADAGELAGVGGGAWGCRGRASRRADGTAVRPARARLAALLRPEPDLAIERTAERGRMEGASERPELAPLAAEDQGGVSLLAARPTNSAGRPSTVPTIRPGQRRRRVAAFLAAGFRRAISSRPGQAGQLVLASWARAAWASSSGLRTTRSWSASSP